MTGWWSEVLTPCAGVMGVFCGEARRPIRGISPHYWLHYPPCPSHTCLHLQATTRLYTDTDVFWPDKKVNPSLISGIMILYLGFRLQRKPDNCCDHWLDCRPQTQDTPHSCNGKLSQFNISCDWTQIRTLVCGNLDIVTSLTWNKSWTLEFVDITSTGIERIVIILIIDHLLGRLHIHIQLI